MSMPYKILLARILIMSAGYAADLATRFLAVRDQ
jgi:hypothetical protein